MEWCEEGGGCGGRKEDDGARFLHDRPTLGHLQEGIIVVGSEASRMHPYSHLGSSAGPTRLVTRDPPRFITIPSLVSLLFPAAIKCTYAPLMHR